MSVEDLLRRDVSFQWFEGVALVQSLCRQLQDAGRGEGGVPSPADIVLGPDGVVSIVRVPSGSDGVAGAARLLSAMQGDDVPVQLRLLVAQATNADSEYRTLGDFSEALAFFERPDSRQILRHLHERASAAPLSPEDSPESLQRAVPETEKKKEKTQPRALRDKKKPAKSPLLVALPVATLACAGVWLFGFGMGDAATNTVPEEQALEVPSAGRAASEPPGADTPSSASARRAGGSALGRSSQTTPLRSNASMLGIRTWLGPLIGAWGDEVLPPLPPDLVSYERIEVTASPVPGVRSSSSPDTSRLYSARDVRVVPPRAVYPKLPEHTGPEPAEPRTVLELVIATDGLVERVRMRNEPRNIHEFMLVSAAKAWRFEPATLDGWPVRFVHSIALPRP